MDVLYPSFWSFVYREVIGFISKVLKSLQSIAPVESAGWKDFYMYSTLPGSKTLRLNGDHGHDGLVKLFGTDMAGR